MHLRDYQAAGLADISAAWRRGHRRVLYTMPTGAGKTVMFCEATRRAAQRGKTTLILVHRRELIKQTVAALGDTAHGVIAAGWTERQGQVQIASVDTLRARLDKYADWLCSVDSVVVDEAHHATADTWRRVLGACSRAYTLGVTATPCRMTGAGLGDYFDDLVCGPAYSDLQADGYLATARVFAPSTVDVSGVKKARGDYARVDIERIMRESAIYGDAVESYRSWGRGAPAIAFCASRAAVDATAQIFRDAGYRAVGIDGATAKQDRDAATEGLACGSVDILVSCDLVSEGFDVPVATVGIMLRPTASLSLWIQQAGRLLRPAPGKASAIILDHVGNTLRHGFPDDDRGWSLGCGAVNKQTRGIGLSTCATCFRMFAPAERCPYCGAAREITARELEQRAAEMAELDRDRARRKRRREVSQCRDMTSLISLARERGYANPGYWASRVIAGRKRKGA